MILIVFLLFYYVNINAQLEKIKCTLSGYLFYSDCNKYYGDCTNNNANGVGTLFFKNSSLTGYFKNNIIQNCNVKYTYNTDNSIVFGQNIGTKLDGVCMKYVNGYVTPLIYSDGQFKGSSLAMVKVPSPNFEMSGKLCVSQSSGFNAVTVDETSITAHIDMVIPGTNYMISRVGQEIPYKAGEEKSWFVLVDFKKNIIIKQFGSYEKPLSVTMQPKFLLFNRNNFPIYEISGWKGSTLVWTKLYKVDLNTYTLKSIDSADRTDILNKKKEKQRIKSITYNNMHVVDTTSPFESDLSYVRTALKDSSYFLIFNNWRREKNAGSDGISDTSAIVRFNNKNTKTDALELSGYTIRNLVIDENSNRLAAFYTSRDSIFLSYFHLSNLHLISTIYSKKRPERMEIPTLKFSNTGLYLIESNRSGTLIYMGSNLHYVCSGVYDFINNSDNIICTIENNTTMFWDLEKKQIFTKMEFPFQYKCILSDEKCYVIPYHINPNTTTSYFVFSLPKPFFPVDGWQMDPEFYTKIAKLQENMNKPLNAKTIDNNQIPAKNELSPNKGNGDGIWGGLTTEQLLANINNGEYQIFNVEAFYSGILKQSERDFQKALSGENDDDVSRPSNNSNNTCSRCNGTGRETCYKCNGTTEVKCNDCHGGYYADGGTCSHCRGRGRASCGDCYGRGTKNCNGCNGTGRERFK